MTGAAFAAPFLERRHMILVKNRELLFSNREQYIGTPYDNNSETRLFAIDRLQMGGVDIADLSFRLDLKYAKTNTSDTSLLDKQITDDKGDLTWTIVNSRIASNRSSFCEYKGYRFHGNSEVEFVSGGGICGGGN